MSFPYYAVVTFGAPGVELKSYYRSLSSAQRDASDSRQSGQPSDVRVLGCASRAEAIAADISGALPVVQR